MPGYVILSAARNEAAYIETTLRSVQAQTVEPLAWVIVSDGSTDATDAIVRRFSNTLPYLHLVAAPSDGSRNFGSKAKAINAAYERVRRLSHDFVAVLDADVSLDANYYESVIRRFEADPKLGLAGGILYDKCGSEFVRQRTSVEWSVSGPIQMFRRRCFEDIGGYRSLPRGGIDAVAESAARMNGWKVRAFQEIPVRHLRRTGAEKGNIFATAFRDGVKEYGYGCDAAFIAAKAVRRLGESPFLVGSLLRLAGYGTAWLRRDFRNLPDDVLEAIRREQRRRLFGRFHRTKSSGSAA